MPRREKFPPGLMILAQGAHIAQPDLADMRGKGDLEQASEIIDRLLPLGLPNSEKHGSRRQSGGDLNSPLPNLFRCAPRLADRLFMLAETHMPLTMKRFERDLLLGAPSRVEGHAACSLSGEAMLPGMGFDLFGAPRHVRDQVPGNAADFKQPLARIEFDLIAALAQQMGKLVPVDLPRYHLLGVHRPCFEAEEALRLPVIGDVHHHHMGVEMRIKFARGVLGKTRKDEPSGRTLGDLAVDSLASRGVLLNPGESDANGPFMGFYDSLIPGDERHDRH